MGTTNLQLIDLAKDLSILNFHCICNNEINQCPTDNTPINIIVNPMILIIMLTVIGVYALYTMIKMFIIHHSEILYLIKSKNL